MNMEELIALARIRSGKSKKQLAAQMGHNHQSRLSRLIAEVAAPEAWEVAFLAQNAGIDELEALIAIEEGRNKTAASVWRTVQSRLGLHPSGRLLR